MLVDTVDSAPVLLDLPNDCFENPSAIALVYYRVQTIYKLKEFSKRSIYHFIFLPAQELPRLGKYRPIEEDQIFSLAHTSYRCQLGHMQLLDCGRMGI